MKWTCLSCGFVYDETVGLPEEGIAPSTAWGQIPEDWACPDYFMAKSDFQMVPFKEASAETRAAC